MREFETLGQWHELWAYILGSAPDRFVNVSYSAPLADQSRALREAFESLRSGFYFAQRKLKDERLSRIAEELIEMSFEAYVRGDEKTGAHTLGECEGLIWPSMRCRVKYAVEAERRAFGENVTYAGVTVSPYPYEGSAADLGADQATLLSLAQRHFLAYQREEREFKYFSWVIDNAGTIRRTSINPREDEHPVLQPVQRSWGYKRLKELGQSGQIRACVLMEVLGSLGDGIVIYNLEQRAHCRVSARQLFKRVDSGFDYEDMRFHLEDPDIFTEVE